MLEKIIQFLVNIFSNQQVIIDEEKTQDTNTEQTHSFLDGKGYSKDFKPNVIKMVSFEEGRKNKPYRDSLGYLTVGVGHLMDARKGGYLPQWLEEEMAMNGYLSESSIDWLLEHDLERIDAELNLRLEWVQNLDEVRYACLLDMAFQLGVGGLLGFVNTLQMIQDGNYIKASEGMKHSLWYKQTTNRAKRRIAQMATGRWGYLGD